MYRKKTKRYEGAYTVTRAGGKEVYLKLRGVDKHFNISQIPPERKRLLSGMGQFKSELPPGLYITDVLNPGNRRSYTDMPDAGKVKELAGLVERGVYEVVCKGDLPEGQTFGKIFIEGVNMLDGRFVLEIKDIGTEQEV